MISQQFQHVSSLYQWILVAIYTALPLIEVVRLYIGNLGNTEEKVLQLNLEEFANQFSKISIFLLHQVISNFHSSNSTYFLTTPSHLFVITVLF